MPDLGGYDEIKVTTYRYREKSGKNYNKSNFVGLPAVQRYPQSGSIKSNER